MAASTSSGFHRYSSFGRHRGIRNVAGAFGTMLHDASTTLPTAAPSAATDGYRTENERFLHIYVKNSENDENHTLTVWGFNYASGVWAELYDVSGNQVELTFNQAKDNHIIFEIAGVDRLYFQGSAHNFHGTDRVAAGLSNF